jgi:dynein heavy chain
MKFTLGEILSDAKETAMEDWIEPDPKKQREYWLNNYCAQLALCATQIMWTEETTRAFDELEAGSEGAMTENLKIINQRVGKLIERVRTDLTEEVRTKIITIITIDVHSRDVVEKFCNEKINSAEHFAWQSQLKFYLEQKDKKDTFKKCQSRIADWSTWYNYEYVGNCGRLVITPLTDRCYITLTQALNLSMGGAPAGPAGTGKTETTKDLGRALGLHVVVYNCSPQMNYKGMAEIFMGLSQAGSWGCFDEFNRIEISVLSVVSTQVKYCLDAIKVLKSDPAKFMFKFGDEEEIPMRITSGYFITMNPGYAGRTELPENLKALFRSCAMVVPDIVLICENMLMAEGFITARDLSKKFMTLYTLSSSLLSKQRHYDWGLRAVKSVLRQAGILKRASPNDPEKLILMRALRDFNTPKIVLDDIDIFMGLINDLFPGCDPPVEFKANVKEACEQCARDPDLCAFKEGKMNIKCEERFIQKCVELYELLVVRHSVFIIGVPGSAKSTIWKLLARACTHIDHETVFDIVDPKCVKNEELFGNMNPKTKEWKDGVLSTMMRDMSKCQGKFTDS